jgi:hypothetical protein
VVALGRPGPGAGGVGRPARPEHVQPALPTAEEKADNAPTIKGTCTYTLDGVTYAVTDTGTQQIGGGWCKHIYQQAVEAQAAADKRR